MGNGVIPNRWFDEFASEDVPMGNAHRGQRRPEIFEGMDEILREGEPHKEIDPDEFAILKEVRATIWG